MSKIFISQYPSRAKRQLERMGERKDAYRVLVGKPERKRPLGRPRYKRQDNIKINLHEAACGHGLD